MSTSTRVWMGCGAAVLLGIGGMIGWAASPRSVYIPQSQQLAYASPQGDIVLAQVMEIMRAQAEDYRKAINAHAEATQRILAQHAQSAERLLTSNAQGAMLLMTQAGNQEISRQTSYLNEQARQRNLARVTNARERERVEAENAYHQQVPEDLESYYGVQHWREPPRTSAQTWNVLRR